MSFLTKEQRYELLCAIRNGKFREGYSTEITPDETKFVSEYAMEKVRDLMRDPECVKALDSFYEQKFAHRFD